ncbi:MAG: thioredoxin [Candidatus Obscuribacterales bacterium]|nr:thioredoxin [Candidatus Obscuribacterales bacterium]
MNIVSTRFALVLSTTVSLSSVCCILPALTQSSSTTKTASAQITDAEWRAQFAKWAAAYGKADYQAAELTLRNMLSQIEKNAPKYQRYHIETISDLIKTEYAQHKTAETKPLYEQLVVQVQKQFGPNSPELARTLKSYSMICSRLGETEKANQLQKQAEFILMHPVAISTGSARPIAIQAGAKLGPSQRSTFPSAQLAGNQPQSTFGGSVDDLQESEFQNLVLASDTPVLIDFYADWCGPCKKMSPLVDAAASTYSGRIKFFRCNVDNNKTLANQFGINSIPTFIVFRNGNAVNKFSGMMSQDELNSFAEAALN